MKKLLSALLLLCTLLTAAACTSTSQPDGKETTAAADAAETTEPTTETEAVFPHDTVDMQGKTLTVLSDEEISGNNLSYMDLSVNELTGDVLNDAIYSRNLKVAEKFNVKFNTFGVEGAASTLRNTVAAGDSEYFAVTMRLANAFSVTKECVDLMTLDNLSLESEWWDKNAVNDLSVAKTLKLVTGDIFIKHYDAAGIMLFNKDIAENYAIENLYETVNSGKWTLDKLGELSESVMYDVDGDGKYGRDDRWGFASHCSDTVNSFINSCGLKYTTKDDNDIPVFNIDIEKLTAIFEKYKPIYANCSFDISKDGGYQNGCAFWMFPEGKSLFYWCMPRYIEWKLRDIEFDYGILPVPKFDEAQKDYITNVSDYHGYCYMIPKSAENPEQSALIMDALAFYGLSEVKPAYYDICLKRKFSTDIESSEMLDIVFSNMVYDIGIYSNFGSFNSSLTSMVLDQKDLDFASLYDSKLKMITRSIDKFVEESTSTD